MTKWMSRKFIVTLVQIVLMIIVPMVYKSMNIGETVIITLLIGIAGAGSFYTGFNVLEKKFGSGNQS